MTKKPSDPPYDVHWAMTLSTWRRGETSDAAGCAGQRARVALHGLRDGSQAGRDRRPLVGRLGRHQVEDRPDVLHRAGDHVEIRLISAGLGELHRDAEPFAHRLDRDPVDRVLGHRGVEPAERAAVELGSSGDAVRGVVGQQVVVSRHPDPCGFGRMQGQRLVEVPVGDAVDGSGLAFGTGCRAHRATLLLPGPVRTRSGAASGAGPMRAKRPVRAAGAALASRPDRPSRPRP